MHLDLVAHAVKVPAVLDIGCKQVRVLAETVVHV